MLVKWGCDLADENGVAVYVDASQEGALLYRKFKFVDSVLDGESGSSGIIPMARPQSDGVEKV